VPTVVSEPQLLCYGMPIESYRVTNSRRKHFEPGTISVHSIDNAMAVVGTTDVAGRTDRNVQHPVGTKGNEFPALVPVTRKFIAHDYRLRGTLQLRFNVVVACHAGDLYDVQRSIPKRNTGRHFQARSNF